MQLDRELFVRLLVTLAVDDSAGKGVPETQIFAAGLQFMVDRRPSAASSPLSSAAAAAARRLQTFCDRYVTHRVTSVDRFALHFF